MISIQDMGWTDNVSALASIGCVYMSSLARLDQSLPTQNVAISKDLSIQDTFIVLEVAKDALVI